MAPVIKPTSTNVCKFRDTQQEPAAYTIDVDIVRANVRLTNEMLNMKAAMLEYIKEICTLNRMNSEQKIEIVKMSCALKESESENKQLRTRIQILNEQAFTADLIQLD